MNGNPVGIGIGDRQGAQSGAVVGKRRMEDGRLEVQWGWDIEWKSRMMDEKGFPRWIRFEGGSKVGGDGIAAVVGNVE